MPDLETRGEPIYAEVVGSLSVGLLAVAVLEMMDRYSARRVCTIFGTNHQGLRGVGLFLSNCAGQTVGAFRPYIRTETGTVRLGEQIA